MTDAVVLLLLLSDREPVVIVLEKVIEPVEVGVLDEDSVGDSESVTDALSVHDEDVEPVTDVVPTEDEEKLIVGEGVALSVGVGGGVMVSVNVELAEGY